nr:unnamed protein product [Digitaria exilis]
MDLFPDRAHVRLRSRVRGAYLHADEDGVSVSLRARRASLNTAWQVHRVPRDDGFTYVLLHSAAYGRYLARSPGEAPRGHRGNGAYLRLYRTPEQEDVLWVAIRYGDHVRLRHVSYSLLRANGRYRRWLNGVSVDNDAGNQSTMTHWRVEAIPPRAQPPALPLPTPGSNGYHLCGSEHFVPLQQHPEELRRIIVYVQVDDLVNYDPLARRTFWFHGRSVSNLRNSLANHLNEDSVDNITACVRAGSRGRLTPLVVDLPRNQVPMFIIVLTTGSPGEKICSFFSTLFTTCYLYLFINSAFVFVFLYT